MATRFEHKNATAARKMNKCINAVDKFNADLQEYINTTGDNELPILDTTVVGWYEPLDPAEVTICKTFVKVVLDGTTYRLRPVKDDDEWTVENWDDYFNGLKQDITEQRKRLNKAWRIWKSENPDREEESDTEDEA